LTETTVALRAAVDRWLARGNPSVGGPPLDVTFGALYQQRIYIVLSARPRLARATIARLPGWLAAQARDNAGARRELASITPRQRLPAFRTGRALPAGVLLGYYRSAERRFLIAWQVLAAVNFVESAFNKLRNASAAGAQGPMQFMPSTWRVYGLGGNVHDPRDAILGAANFLRAHGAPRNYRRALHAYNPSWLYVDAVLRYTRQIRSDRRAFFVYYSRQVFVRTPSGDKRLTGPGR
jgi:hypothetical protein